jgi:hypothetical protein
MPAATFWGPTPEVSQPLQGIPGNGNLISDKGGWVRALAAIGSSEVSVFRPAKWLIASQIVLERSSAEQERQLLLSPLSACSRPAGGLLSAEEG